MKKPIPRKNVYNYLKEEIKTKWLKLYNLKDKPIWKQ